MIDDVLKHEGEIFRMALFITSNDDQAKELCQMAYLKLLSIQNKRGNLNHIFYNDKPNLGYVYKILRNLFIDQKRRESKGVVTYQETLPEHFTLSSLTDDQHEKLDAVKLAINNLPYYQRWICRLYFFHGHSLRSLAKESDTNYRWVYHRLMLAINNIKQQLQNDRQRIG